MRKSLFIIIPLLALAGCTQTETKTIVKKHYVNQMVKVYAQNAIVKTFSNQEKAQNYLNSIKNINDYTVSMSTSSYVKNVDTKPNNGAMDDIKLGTNYTVTLIKKAPTKG